jgi:hypothetical protein
MVEVLTISQTRTNMKAAVERKPLKLTKMMRKKIVPRLATYYVAFLVHEIEFRKI